MKNIYNQSTIDKQQTLEKAKCIKIVYDRQFDDLLIENKFNQSKPISKALFKRMVLGTPDIDKYSEFRKYEGYYFLINPATEIRRDMVDIYYSKVLDHIADVYNPEYNTNTTFKFYCTDLQFKKMLNIINAIKEIRFTNFGDITREELYINYQNLKKDLHVLTRKIKFECIDKKRT